MKPIFEFLLDRNNSKTNDGFENIDFKFEIDDEAKDIFDPDDPSQLIEFKENFSDLSENAFKLLKSIKLTIWRKEDTKQYDEYSFYLNFNKMDEFWEMWKFNKIKNRFEKPSSNCRRFYGREWYKRDSARKSIIQEMIEEAKWKLDLNK